MTSAMQQPGLLRQRDDVSVVPPIEPSDASLIADAVHNPLRFEPIFERHFAVIYRCLRRRVGDDLAQEFTAETFSRAFAQRERFDANAASAVPWLFGIAGNVLRMHHRSETRRLRAWARVAAQPSLPDNSVDQVTERHTDPRVAAALATLSADQREVLLLHAWAELSDAEIAEALGVNAATVRSRLARARARAARVLTEETRP
jgi:RNA polymerase sigma factor (sigma-70 family)